MLSGEQWMLVLAMAAVLFLTRIAGLIIADHLPDSAGLTRVLDMLPGITMVAIVLPEVASSGAIGVAASGFVWLVVSKTGNLGIAILAGVGVVAILG